MTLLQVLVFIIVVEGVCSSCQMLFIEYPPLFVEPYPQKDL